MKQKIIVEVAASSVEDCRIASICGADRIELSSALELGGLTPSIGTVRMVKKHTSIPVVCMIRSREGGFHYSDREIETMILDAQALLDVGVDGLVFGFLEADGSVDKETTRYFSQMCHDHDVEAIFHRAFDRVTDPIRAIEDLIECGITRLLTSGLTRNAIDGTELIAQLIHEYEEDIEFVIGSGVNENNVMEIVNKTAAKQVHSTFQGWYKDSTTMNNDICIENKSGDYRGVDPHKCRAVIQQVKDD